MREIPPDKIGDFAEELLTKLLQTTVLESDARLKLATPVDTGRLRANWFIGEGVDPVSYTHLTLPTILLV